MRSGLSCITLQPSLSVEGFSAATILSISNGMSSSAVSAHGRADRILPTLWRLPLRTILPNPKRPSPSSYEPERPILIYKGVFPADRFEVSFQNQICLSRQPGPKISTKANGFLQGNNATQLEGSSECSGVRKSLRPHPRLEVYVHLSAFGARQPRFREFQVILELAIIAFCQRFTLLGSNEFCKPLGRSQQTELLQQASSRNGIPLLIRFNRGVKLGAEAI